MSMFRLGKVLALSALVSSAAHAADYLPGGPLAGRVLPKSPTGPAPEVELFPGSVEHWRAYWMKYTPSRSFFDVQSQLKIWKAPDIPGAKSSEEYASPVYAQPENGAAVNTGKTLPPVPVIRCKAGDPVFKLDLGELDVGMYALRVVGAVETARLRRFRDPLFLRLTINDGLKNETTTYRIRTGYVDEIYSVGDFYFHAPEKRKYHAELTLDKGTTTEVLVQSITLDDVLAGTTREAVKTRRTFYTDAAIARLKAGEEEASAADGEGEKDEPVVSAQQGVFNKLARDAKALPRLSPAERLARDEQLWKRTPPLNSAASLIPTGGTAASQASAGGSQWSPGEPGTPDQTLAEFEAEFGKWEPAEPWGTAPSRDPALANAFLQNKKLGLTYTIDDLIARKPLPDPYPVKDDGAGVYYPDPKNPEKGRVMAPIAKGVALRYRENTSPARNAATIWLMTGHEDFGRDAAVSLIRAAMQFPSLETGNALDSVVCIPQYQNRDSFARQRADLPFWLSHYPLYDEAVKDYDLIFDYIKGNEELAKSINRFVPWVKTSQDVIKLLDTYLVQTTAKRIMRYHYYTYPGVIATVATVQGDPKVTAPWMDWMFSRVSVYPYGPASIQDLLISASERAGPRQTGSTYYSQEGGAIAIAKPVLQYVQQGGDPRFDLSDPARYPKPLQQCWWQLNTIVGGADFARIGDVCGPDKQPFMTAGVSLESASRDGWRWSADPRFAWMLKNVFGRKDENDDDWKKIVSAADTVKRAPWLDLPSRHIDNNFAALESGLEHDDYRFRRTAYVRTGVGVNHAHADALDLQFFSHGLPMTIDGGQRSGYSKPNDKFTRIHNVVEVSTGTREPDRFGHQAYGWIAALSDAPGARYLEAVAKPPRDAKIFRRQLALIDVNEGAGSEPLPVALQQPRPQLKPGVTPGVSYIFDVFRVSGGAVHSYGFHGPVNDDFVWNVANAKPVAEAKDRFDDMTDEGFLSEFVLAKETKQAGDAPETFQATWRASRADKVPGTEITMLGQNYDPAAPRKFTRLTLHETAGLRALKADSVSTFFAKNPYSFTQTMLVRRDPGGKLESAFAAIIEPYAGEPSILSQKLIEIPGNEKDALRAVAIRLELKDGRTDLCFADGQRKKVRQFSLNGAPAQISGEFGYHSKDADGFRQATLTGGILLEAPDVVLRAPQRDYSATITKVDYLKKTFWTDKPLPPGSAGRVFEVLPPGCPTSFTIAEVVPDGEGSRVTVTAGADFYRSAIREITENPPTVRGSLPVQTGRGASSAGMTMTNDDMTKSWRTTSTYHNINAPATAADFAPSNAVRLWEYGVGDNIRLAAAVSLRRIEKNIYEAMADETLTVKLKGSALESSPDRTTWKPLAGEAKDGWIEGTLTVAKGEKYLRVTP